MFLFRYLSFAIAILIGSHPVLAQNEKPFFDYLIKRAIIFDGQSPNGVLGDVAIQGDKVVAVGDLSDTDAVEVIDAKGYVLSPGFIDVITHSDFNPIIYPELPNKLLQGVTTEIIGHSGMSAAPALGPYYSKIPSVWAREGVILSEKPSWKTFKEYRERMSFEGLLTNFAGLVGHGNLRAAVMGFSAREASQSEIEQMKHLLSNALAEGAYGISFGLAYLPGIYASQDEVVQLCREVAFAAGVCAFLPRDDGDHLLESISEIIEVADQTSATVIISPFKVSNKKNWEKTDRALELIEKARLRGLRLWVEATPYRSGAAALGTVLPRSLYQREDRNAYFKDLFSRGKLLDELRIYDDHGFFQWDKIVIASTKEKTYRSYEGSSFKKIARQTKKEPEKILIDILADNDFEVSAFYFTQSEKIVERVIEKSYVAIGSDSIADGSRRPHPRAYGTFPKVLRRHVKKRKAVSIGEAIRKMTSQPADYYGLKGRGVIHPGFYADLILFDAGDVKDRASYEDPSRFPEGIEWVFVNGSPVIREGRAAGIKKGRFLIR